MWKYIKIHFCDLICFIWKHEVLEVLQLLRIMCFDFVILFMRISETKVRFLKIKYDISFLNKTDLGVRKSRCLGRYNKTQCTFFPNCFVFETGSFYGALAVPELTDPPASASPHTTTTGCMFVFCYFWDTILLSIAQTGLELSMCPSLTASASAEIASMRWHAQPNIMHFHYKALKQLNIAFKKALYIIYTCVRVNLGALLGIKSRTTDILGASLF